MITNRVEGWRRQRRVIFTVMVLLATAATELDAKSAGNKAEKPSDTGGQGLPEPQLLVNLVERSSGSQGGASEIAKSADVLPSGDNQEDDGDDDSLRSLSTYDFDDTLTELSGPKPKKSTFWSRRFGAVTDWIDDYKTRKSGYGPPYFEEYGGDLPDDCNKLGADLVEIDELLQNGANPNVGKVEDHGLSPLHFAARFGNVELLKMLKRAGGNPGITNALGLTPLSYTCSLKLSVDRNGGDTWEGMQVAAVRWLLEQGADPNHVDKAGYTPLAWACRSGILPAVQELVEAGADVMQRRTKLPGGSQVRLPKADILAVTSDRQIQRFIQAKINAVLQREQAIIRRDVRQDTRNVRLKIIQDAIATRQEARQFLLQEKRRVKDTEKLGAEVMRIDHAEEARKERRKWLQSLKGSPGVWTKTEVQTETDARPQGGTRPPMPPGISARRARPRWVFDTSMAFSKNEAAAFDVLEQARQVEAFILNGNRKHKIIAPRWRAMTGKRLLRLEHGQRWIGRTKKGRRQQGGQTDDDRMVKACIDGRGSDAPLSGLEEEHSDSSSRSSSSSSSRGGSPGSEVSRRHQ